MSATWTPRCGAVPCSKLAPGAGLCSPASARADGGGAGLGALHAGWTHRWDCPRALALLLLLPTGCTWADVQRRCAANVYLPKDRVTNQHMGYGFVEFRSEDDADYVRSGCCLND